MKLKSLSPIRPKHRTDCAIVSVAALTGHSYEKVLKTMLPKRKKYTQYGATLPQVLRCLKKFNFKFKEIQNPIITKLKNHAFLVIKKRHWLHGVVWDCKNKVILDGNRPPSSLRKYQKMIVDCFEIEKVKKKI